MKVISLYNFHNVSSVLLLTANFHLNVKHVLCFFARLGNFRSFVKDSNFSNVAFSLKGRDERQRLQGGSERRAEDAHVCRDRRRHGVPHFEEVRSPRPRRQKLPGRREPHGEGRRLRAGSRRLREGLLPH